MRNEDKIRERLEEQPFFQIYLIVQEYPDPPPLLQHRLNPLRRKGAGGGQILR
jgi:hypothetical protein